MVAMDSSSSAMRMRFFSFPSLGLGPDTLKRGTLPRTKIKTVAAPGATRTIRSAFSSQSADQIRSRVSARSPPLMARILHIEDDPTNRLLVRKLLGPPGHDVIDAVDGLDGIKKAIEE